MSPRENRKAIKQTCTRAKLVHEQCKEYNKLLSQNLDSRPAPLTINPETFKMWFALHSTAPNKEEK